MSFDLVAPHRDELMDVFYARLLAPRAALGTPPGRRSHCPFDLLRASMFPIDPNAPDGPERSEYLRRNHPAGIPSRPPGPVRHVPLRVRRANGPRAGLVPPPTR